ncbi:MAG: ATP synthase F1 subunit gamma [Eubacterium sp.]|nr:ATP synthase F1 subunit gamma [Eubacterium sp.]
MPSMRSIKRRKESVTSTQQITKAMKLVSTVKLQKARAKVEANTPYFEALYKTICSILSKTWELDNRFLTENKSGKRVVIAMSSNRGLAGGYNSNIVKKIDSMGFDKEGTLIYGLGQKGIEGLKRRGYHVEWDESDIINEPLYNDCIAITKTIMEKFDAGEVDEVYVAYTDFENTVTHIPTVRKILPLSREDFQEDIGKLFDESEMDQNLQMNYGMSNSGIERDMVLFGAVMDHYHPEQKILNEIIPKFMTNILYGAFLQSIASENAARMQAMDSATENAEDMISTLELQYNRARQGSITQELTEIIGGAEALS